MRKFTIDASGFAVLAMVIGLAAWNPFEERVGPQPPIVTLEIEADGSTIWNGVPIRNVGTLYQYFRAVARQDPQPEIHLVANRFARFDAVANTLDAARRFGVTRLGFDEAEPRADD
jgi:biopolymer transport protein ExbD